MQYCKLDLDYRTTRRTRRSVAFSSVYATAMAESNAVFPCWAERRQCIPIRAVAYCYAKSREMDDADDSTAGIVAGGSDEDDDARTEYNRGEVPADASGPTPALTTVTPRRLRDLPVRRRAAANTIPRSQPVASTSRPSPQSTT